jgi:competence protein ComEC
MDHPDQMTKRPNKARYHPLVLVVTAVFLGILFDRLTHCPLWFWSIGTLIALAAWLGISLFQRGSTKNNIKLCRTGSIILLIAVMSVAGCWHHIRWNNFDADDLGLLAREVGEPVCIEATVLSTPHIGRITETDPLRVIPRYEQTRFSARATAIRKGSKWAKVSGKTEISVDGHLLGINPSDRIQIFGQLSRPNPPANPGGFSWRSHLRHSRTLACLRVSHPESVTLLERSPWWNPKSWIGSIRASALATLDKHIRPENVGIASAMLLGARERVERPIIDSFQKSGAIHYLVISGLHVGMLVWFFLIVMRGFPISTKKTAAIATLAAIAFTILTGSRPPAIRATVLVIIFCGRWFVYRKSRPFNSLAAAAIVVLIINPTDLFQIGTQLSFLAVAALILWQPVWSSCELETKRSSPLPEEAWQRGPVNRTIRFTGRSLGGIFRVSLIVWLVIMPLTMARFHLFSPVAALANTLLWLPTSLALVSGFFVLIFGLLFPPLAVVAAAICNLNLTVLQWGIDRATAIPGSHWFVPGPSDWWLVGFYAIGLISIIPFRFRPRPTVAAAMLALWIVLGASTALLSENSDAWEANFLSVGHGGATLVELPGGKTLLFDCGSISSPKRASSAVADLLWEKGLTHIDAVVLSHPDADHYNGLPSLLDRVSVGSIYVPPKMFHSEKTYSAIGALAAACRESEIPIFTLAAGDQLEAGPNATIRVLHPSLQFAEHNNISNAQSVVLEIDCFGRKILLTGDIEPPGLDCLLSQKSPGYQLMMAPHHGSGQSNPPELARWSDARWALISGSLAKYDPKAQEPFRQRGIRLLHTGRDGAIRLSGIRDNITVEQFHQPLQKADPASD